MASCSNFFISHQVTSKISRGTEKLFTVENGLTAPLKTIFETLSIELKRWSKVFQEFVVIQEVIFGVVVIRQGPCFALSRGDLRQNNET